MKAWMLAGAMSSAIGTVSLADNRATNSCDIVTRNPVVFMYGGGDIWFGDGPYRSLADARLARSTMVPARRRIPPPTEPRSVQRVAAAPEGPAQGHRCV